MTLIRFLALPALFLTACSGTEPPPEDTEPVEPPAPEVDETYEALKSKLKEGEAVVKCAAPDRPDERKLLETRWREVQLKQDTIYGIAPAETGNLWFKAPWNGPWDALEVFWDTREGEDNIVCVFEDREFAALIATPSSPPEGAFLSAIGCEDLLGGRWPVLQKANPVLRLDTNLTTECTVQVLSWKLEEGKDPMFARGPEEAVKPVPGAATPLALEPPKADAYKVATEAEMGMFAAHGGKLPWDAKEETE